MKAKKFEAGQRLEVQPEPGEPWVGAAYLEPWKGYRGWHFVLLDEERREWFPDGSGGRDVLIKKKIVHSQRIRVPKVVG